MRFIVALFITLAPAVTLAGDPYISRGGPEYEITVNYAVYASGFKALDASIRIVERANYYETDVRAKIRDGLYKILPWEGRFFSRGTTGGNQWRPRFHRATSTWKGETDTDILEYDRSGILTRAAEVEEGVESTRNIPSEASKALDMMTALLGSFRDPMDQVCEGNNKRIFDGKRVFDLSLSRLRTDKLTTSRYSNYNGSAVVCDIEIIPVAGFRKEKRGYFALQEQAKKNGQLPKIWLGQLDGYPTPMPVKMLIKSNYGSVVMHYRGH
jgi:hypothetical protein